MTLGDAVVVGVLMVIDARLPDTDIVGAVEEVAVLLRLCR